jgi:hypothetical protein
MKIPDQREPYTQFPVNDREPSLFVETIDKGNETMPEKHNA